jgi:hypothetical protein
MNNEDLIISINVHEKPEYLKEQIENINTFVFLKKKIILNCNDYMYNEMIGSDLKDTIINPNYFNKSRFHGSLVAGIISNMKYAINNYNFSYFLVISSREFFYRNLENFSQIEENERSPWKLPENKNKNYLKNDWHWPSFKMTKLYEYLEKNNMYISASAHEGMCFGVESCQYIVDFLNNNPDIEKDIIDFPNCVEEFALQSICSNSNEGKYYCLGNGPGEVESDKANPLKLTHKKNR